MYTFKPSLFIFLLSLSMHAICDARNIGVVSEGFHTKLLFSAKVGEKVEHSTDTVLGSNDREGISEKSSAPGAAILTRESKDSKAITKSSGHDQNPIKPLVSVSWYTPHQNHRQIPGFQSDYAMPRTRTPSHN
ncbi:TRANSMEMBRANE PROTEIN [Salix viminalis]|uniref:TRANSMEMBRANE PROTEIN n=1 Tax=Salix viminalis TaxID=40686 RepID=A0A9Q0YYC7_SALVM|nr:TRANSMEMBRANE PROTEIN [Salix viminalis]